MLSMFQCGLQSAVAGQTGEANAEPAADASREDLIDDPQSEQPDPTKTDQSETVVSASEGEEGDEEYDPIASARSGTDKEYQGAYEKDAQDQATVDITETDDSPPLDEEGFMVVQPIEAPEDAVKQSDDPLLVDSPRTLNIQQEEELEKRLEEQTSPNTEKPVTTEQNEVEEGEPQTPRTLRLKEEQDFEKRMEVFLHVNSKQSEPEAKPEARTSMSRDQSFPEENSIQNSIESSVKFLPGAVEDIDLDYVEEYDNAFNEFLTKHPRFLIDNPDLSQQFRIVKLQKLLEIQDNKEATVMNQLDGVTRKKTLTELSWHEQLREAARKKAARETHLQSYLGGIHYNTKCMEAQLTWHMVCDSENRVKKQFILQNDLKSKKIGPESKDLLEILPDSPEFENLRECILVPPGESLSEEQEKDLSQFQMDNAFLAAEVAVLKKKVAYQKIEAKKHAWVESVLMQLDDKSIKKLKSRFKKRAGVPL